MKKQIIKEQILTELKGYLGITLGTVLMSAGVYFFKIPNGFVTGGVAGIGTVLGSIAPILSAGQWIMFINISLLVLGYVFLGKMNTIRTVYCSLLFSLLTYLMEYVVLMDSPFTKQPLLELIYALALTSAGSAIIFNNAASSGGMDIVALILKKYTNWRVGKALLTADFFVAFSSFFVFGIEAGLFSMLGLFSKAFLVDSIIDNINSCKYFVVITEKVDEINSYIMKELHHGATVTKAIGAYTQTEKYMIHTVCKRMEAIRLRHSIMQIDPGAFVVITTTSEIVGRGFQTE